MFSMMPYRTNRPISTRDVGHYLNPFNDDFFRAFFGDHFANDMLRAERPLKVDVKDEGDHYSLEADMPGMKRENVHVDVNNGVLTISSQYDEHNEQKEVDDKYIYRERRYGSMSRSFNLDGIREDGITAEFNDGVLHLNLPKEAEAEKPTHYSIEIH